jgi:hypothetical protein
MISCSSINNSKKIEKEEKMFINIKSIYSNDKISLSINDSIYFVDYDFRSGPDDFDPQISIVLDGNYLHLKGKFTALLIPEIDSNYTRTISLDTILYKKNGAFIKIGAKYDKVFLSQTFNELALE